MSISICHPWSVRFSTMIVVALALTMAVACSAHSGTSVPPAISPGATSPTERPVPRMPVRFRALDGVRIAGSVFGDGTVGAVLGHESDGDQTEWWEFARTLARTGYTALTIDYRNYCPGGDAGCSGSGPFSGAWKDMLGATRFLGRRGVTRVVLIGGSMGATISVVAAANAGPDVAGVVALSGPVQCCGVEAGRNVVHTITVPMLFIAGRFDAGFVGDTRRWERWAGPHAQAVILPSGEHGVNLLRFATPDVRSRATSLILDLMSRVG